MADLNASAEPSARYCREIEAHLCRRNGGHLIRIVGPAFEQVCRWAARGIPLKVAFRGIDRYCERDAAKGPRRRPVRIEFCEADVLDVFDEWRRALGVTALAVAGSELGADDEPGGDAEPAGRHGSLPAHLDRVLARLSALRASEDSPLDGVLDQVVPEIQEAHARARGLRGEARQALIARLRALDQLLIDAARVRIDQATLQGIRAEAEADLAPFRARMTAEAYERSHAASIDRLVREHLRLPVVSYE